jgi:hypothetical protein
MSFDNSSKARRAFGHAVTCYLNCASEPADANLLGEREASHDFLLERFGQQAEGP